MLIQEALRSGKRFRRKDSNTEWTSIKEDFYLTKESALADDWETEKVSNVSISAGTLHEGIMELIRDNEIVSKQVKALDSLTLANLKAIEEIKEQLEVLEYRVAVRNNGN